MQLQLTTGGSLRAHLRPINKIKSSKRPHRARERSEERAIQGSASFEINVGSYMLVTCSCRVIIEQKFRNVVDILACFLYVLFFFIE